MFNYLHTKKPMKKKYHNFISILDNCSRNERFFSFLPSLFFVLTIFSGNSVFSTKSPYKILQKQDLFPAATTLTPIA